MELFVRIVPAVADEGTRLVESELAVAVLELVNGKARPVVGRD